MKNSDDYKRAKKIATEFFRYWWNKEGSNTDQGFDDWWNELHPPKLQKINMHQCISSKIDMEFSDKKFTTTYISVGKLNQIQDGVKPFVLSQGHTFNHCRPRMNHIHACPDGFDKCPLPEGFIINLWNNKGGKVWAGNSSGCDRNWGYIIMFEVVGIVDGYEL